MFGWLKRIFDRSDDPVYSCDLYRDKEAGSCAHVDGPLCDFPKCSMLSDYRREKEGMTIKDDPQFREDLRKMMAEQRGKSGPVPHRGKLNTPALVPHVAQELARIKGLEVEEIAKVTRSNTCRLFSLGLSTAE